MCSEKTVQQKVETFISPLFIGLENLDKDLKRIDFFRHNPDYHYAILERFVRGHFNAAFNENLQISPSEFYATIQWILEKTFGKQNALISAMCTYINVQQRIYASRQQQFDASVAQAQKRIAELEARLK